MPLKLRVNLFATLVQRWMRIFVIIIIVTIIIIFIIVMMMMMMMIEGVLK